MRVIIYHSKMEETSNKALFFGKKDLIGFIYYYYLPKLIPSEKQELSVKITKYKGVSILT